MGEQPKNPDRLEELKREAEEIRRESLEIKKDTEVNSKTLDDLEKKIDDIWEIIVNNGLMTSITKNTLKVNTLLWLFGLLIAAFITQVFAPSFFNNLIP